VEGAWSGPYIKMGFPHALTFTGSGAALTPGGVVFATPTHSLEPLYVLRAGQRLHCSNSLRHVLVSADDDIDPGYMFYDVDITMQAFGTKRYKSRIPTRDCNYVTLHQMPGKIARSTPRPPFGPPVVRVAARSSRVVSGKLENCYYSRQFGSHLENLGYIHPSSLFTYRRGTWTCASVYQKMICRHRA
jgi:hypothetical protein